MRKSYIDWAKFVSLWLSHNYKLVKYIAVPKGAKGLELEVIPDLEAVKQQQFRILKCLWSFQ